MAYLFFYGTLAHEHGGALAGALVSRLGPGRRGFVKGRLLAIGTNEGWYPGLVAGNGRIEGWLYRCDASFDRATLRALDAYEGYNPRRMRRSEYLRRTTPVTLARGGTVRAQVYVWNGRSRSAAVEIAGGSFARFIQETGLPVFGA
jgi:gamma-glutamylcyclotransferase (GGCT)/AIG2-like uncharacterized protein YtfP